MNSKGRYGKTRRVLSKNEPTSGQSEQNVEMHNITRNQSRGTDKTQKCREERVARRKRGTTERRWMMSAGWQGRIWRKRMRKCERERERERKRERERERERERGREHSRLPASQSASPGQHRPGIVAYAPAPLLSRTINLASIPDRPFSMSPSTLVATCAPRGCVCVRARARMDTRYQRDSSAYHPPRMRDITCRVITRHRID